MNHGFPTLMSRVGFQEIRSSEEGKHDAGAG